jgi:hypothetical protein
MLQKCRNQDKRLHFWLKLAAINLIFGNAEAHDPLGNAQDFGGAGLIASRQAERLENHLLLDLFELGFQDSFVGVRFQTQLHHCQLQGLQEARVKFFFGYQCAGLD